LVERTLGGTLEVVVRQTDNKLHHYYRSLVDVVKNQYEWKPGGPEQPFPKVPTEGNITSAPALIEASDAKHRLQVVVRRSDNKLYHYYREYYTASDTYKWLGGDVIPTP
jgi:hypothetical protein